MAAGIHGMIVLRSNTTYSQLRTLYQPLAVITNVSDFFAYFLLVDIMKDGVEIFHFSKPGDKWPIITGLMDF